jgi:hypothetical protein
MSAYSAIPLMVARAAKLFEKHGIEVVLVPFNRRLEREIALQTGVLDRTVSDLINAMQSWTHRFGARVTSATEGNFSLLASPNSARARCHNGRRAVGHVPEPACKVDAACLPEPEIPADARKDFLLKFLDLTAVC